jgi:hypothetical protein
VSKALLPFARRCTFGKIEVWNHEKLQKLTKVVDGSFGAGSYVTKLSLEFMKSEKDDGFPSTKEFLLFLSRLSALEELTLQHSTRLIKAFLTDTRTRRFLPALRRLNLRDAFTGWSNPFDFSHYSQLTRHKELHILDLDVEREATDLGRYAGPQTFKPLDCKWQWCLVLSGSLSNNPAACSLVSKLDQIRSLYIYERAECEGIPRLIRHLGGGDILKTLFLDFPSPLPAATVDKLSKIFPQLTVLSTLLFSRHAFSSSFIPALQTLFNLARLDFLDGCGVTATDLQRLFIEPTHHSSLRRLTLSHSWIYSWIYTYEENWRQLKVPCWTVDFSQKDAEQLLDACEKRGVEVEGVVPEHFAHEKKKKDEVERRKKERRKEDSD